MKKWALFLSLMGITMFVYGGKNDSLTYLYKKLHTLNAEQKNMVNEVKKINAMLDSITSQDKVMYEAFQQRFTKKETTIEQLQNDVSSVKQAFQRQQIQTSWGILLLAVVLLIALIYTYRTEKKIRTLTKTNDDEHRSIQRSTQEITEKMHQDIVAELSQYKNTLENRLEKIQQMWTENLNQNIQQLTTTTNENLNATKQSLNEAIEQLKNQLNLLVEELKKTMQQVQAVEKQLNETSTNLTLSIKELQQATADEEDDKILNELVEKLENVATNLKQKFELIEGNDIE